MWTTEIFGNFSNASIKPSILALEDAEQESYAKIAISPVSPMTVASFAAAVLEDAL